MPTRSLIIVMTAVLVAVLIVTAPLGSARTPAATTTVASASPTSTTPPPRSTLSPPTGDAARAVDRLVAGMRSGDVEGMCRPGRFLTTAVVGAMDDAGLTCEADVEAEFSATPPKGVVLLGISTLPDVATARVRSAGGTTVPLTLVRDGRRWLVSFSHGADPISALLS